MYAFRCFNKHQEKFLMKEMEKFTENIRGSRSVVPACCIYKLSEVVLQGNMY